MGKRRKERSDEKIIKKIKRLEKELKSRQEPSADYYQNEDPTDHYELENGDGDEGDVDVGVDDVLIEFSDNDDNEIEAVPRSSGPKSYVVRSTPASHPSASDKPHETPVEDSSEKQLEGQTTDQEEESTVPPEILAILGESKKSDEILGKKILSEISERWGKILVEGLCKEQREVLLKKVLIPENFTLAKAPKLNAEVASILTQPSQNRDKRLEKRQNQLGIGISGLTSLISELISKDLSKIDIIQSLSEINQILLDVHYEESMNRRRLIIPLLDKRFINIIQGVKREKFLFGDSLVENIKTNKSIEKSGQQIKKSINQLPPTTLKPTTGVQGNCRAPPRQASKQGQARTTHAYARFNQPLPSTPSLPPLLSPPSTAARQRTQTFPRQPQPAPSRRSQVRHYQR